MQDGKKNGEFMGDPLCLPTYVGKVRCDSKSRFCSLGANGAERASCFVLLSMPFHPTHTSVSMCFLGSILSLLEGTKGKKERRDRSTLCLFLFVCSAEAGKGDLRVAYDTSTILSLSYPANTKIQIRTHSRNNFSIFISFHFISHSPQLNTLPLPLLLHTPSFINQTLIQ